MPQIVNWHATPQQVHSHIEQALVIVEDFELTAGERERLLPVVVELLSEKALMAIPDAPLSPIAIPGNARR